LSQLGLKLRVTNIPQAIDSAQQKKITLKVWSPVGIAAGRWAVVNVRRTSVWLHKVPEMSSHGTERLVIIVIYKH
jgi:hypothetical protein